MDPEILKELNESLRELNDTLKKQSSDLVNHSLALSNSNQATNNNTNAVNNANRANNNAAQATSKYGQTVSAVDAELQKQNLAFSRAIGATKTAAIDFGRALTSADTSLTKYGSSASQLGGTAWDVGKNFGLLGMAVGGLLAGLGLAANSILTLNQNIIDFRDGFTKQAGVLPITTDNLGKLASEAGFAYNKMPMLTKTVQNLGSSLLSLGGYAGEGAVRFMNIANVGEETRKRFSRMGLQQQDLLEYQSYYIELQKASGQSQENKRKTDQQIQRESLLYAENLMILSGLTGEKADTIKNRQQQELLKLEEQSAVLAENEEVKRLRALGTEEANARADEIKANQKLRQDTISYLAGLGRESEAFATGSVMRLGSYTDATAKFANVGLLQQANALKQNRDIVGFAENLTSSQVAQNERMNTATQFVADAAEQMGGMGRESLTSFNNIGNNLRESTARLRESMDERGAEGTDPLADTAASIQELEIVASQKFQSFLETIDPFRNGLELFKDAALLAAAAIGGGALLAGLAKVIGGRFGELGSPNNPMHVKMSSGPNAPTAGKGIGSRLKSIFSRSAAPAAAAVGAVPAAAATGPLSRATTGATALSGAAGSAGGSKVGMFLMGLANGLKAFSNPKILVGATVLSGSIAIIGAGIAGATWIIGKSLPSLATGLQAFNKIDGDRLQKIGTGMAGMAAGLLAIGGSSITDAMGSLAQWLSGDESNPIENLGKELTKFQNINVDSTRIEENSKAFIAFNKMLAQATEISGTVAGALSRAFGSFFEVEIPLDKFKAFSDLDIDAEQSGKNATAFKLFSEAMSSYKGFGTLNALGVISNALGGSVLSFYNALPTDEPIERFEKFSKIKINGEQTKINASAFKDFANALAEYKGGPGVMEALSQLAGGALMSLFGVDGPIDAFRKFAQEDFGPNMERNTQALTSYANSTSGAGGGGAPSSGGGGGGGGGSGAPAGGDGGGTASAAQPSSAPAPATSGEAGTTATPASEVPTIDSGKDAALAYAESLNPAARSEFYRSLASQSMQRVAAARAAGNNAQATMWERAANQFHLASTLAESEGQAGNSAGGGENNNSNRTDRPQLASISAQGHTVPVAAEVAPKFQQVLDKLTSVGYRINSLGGYNDRNIAGTNTKSAHSRGWAIDINPSTNPHGPSLRTDLPAEAIRHARSLGLGWGGDWRSSKDAMHFSAQKNEGGYLRAQAGGIFTNSPTMLTDGMSEAQKIGMLNPQSLISRLGKTASEEVSTTETVSNEVDTDLTPELLAIIESKLERVLFSLENNQSTHEKILKNSM